jgi:hypothetical protein
MLPGFRLENDVYGCWPANRETCSEHGEGVSWNEMLQRCIHPELEIYLKENTN